MKFTFKYTESEFKMAINQSHGDSNRIIFDVVLSIVMLAYGIYLSLSKSPGLLSIILVVISLLYLFVLFARNFIVPALVFRKEPKYREEYTLSFKDDEIIFTTGTLKSTLKWDFYTGMKESKDFIFLIYGKKLFTIIPKRIFKGMEEMNEFKELVRSKISDNTRPGPR